MMSSHVANVVMISTCCERWFNAQKHGMFCGLPKPNCQTACFGYIFPGWCYLYMVKSYIASYQMQEEVRI